MVADERSLCESAQHLHPQLAVVDLALAHGDIGGLIKKLRLGCAGLKVIVLSAHVEETIAQAVRNAGAEGLVNKQQLATDLIPAVEDVLRGKQHFPS